MAKAIGLGKPFDDLIEAHDKYAGILKRNPTLIETESLSAEVYRVRTLLGAFNKSLQVAGLVNGLSSVEAWKSIRSIAAPYLKTRHSSTMLALLGDAGDMCAALQETANAGKVEQLGLTAQVTGIKELVTQCNKLLDIRGEEKEYRRRLGSATKARTVLQKQYRLIFATIIPSIYLLSNDATVKAKIVELVNHANATLDIFRHLISGGGNEGGGIDDEDTRPDTPDNPDTPDEPDEEDDGDEDVVPPPEWEDPDA
ncbi:MAG: DUF6261 family protein [Mediterranea sp.]|nr:DUF6261 family protein [Mediterranea sp.]